MSNKELGVGDRDQWLTAEQRESRIASSSGEGGEQNQKSVNETQPLAFNYSVASCPCHQGSVCGPACDYSHHEGCRQNLAPATDENLAAEADSQAGLFPWEREPDPCWSCGGEAEARDDLHVRCIDTKRIDCEVMNHWYTHRTWNTRTRPTGEQSVKPESDQKSGNAAKSTVAPTTAISKDIQAVVAGIRERRLALDPEDAKGDRCYECSYTMSRHSPSVVNPCPFHANAPSDIDTLLGIVDALHEALGGMVAAFDGDGYGDKSIVATTRECALSVAIQTLGWARPAPTTQAGSGFPSQQIPENCPASFPESDSASTRTTAQPTGAVCPITEASHHWKGVMAIREEVYMDALGILCEPDLFSSNDTDLNAVAGRIADRVYESLIAKSESQALALANKPEREERQDLG